MTQDVVVTQAYAHGGTGGSENRLSSIVTGVAGGGFAEQWHQSFTYTPLGKLDQEQYPCQWNGSNCTDSAPSIGRTYYRGFLDSVPGWIDKITYHDNGSLDTIDFAGTGSGPPSYFQGRDSNRMQRPGSFGVEGLRELALAFDGSGNVKRVDVFDISGMPTVIGTETALYDVHSRVSKYDFGTAGNTQDYVYDDFGNVTDIVRDTVSQSNQIDHATNRQTGSSVYDAFGNLTRSVAGLEYEWDALGSLTRNLSSGDVYLYAADEERLGIVPGSGGAPTWRLRDLAGMVVREIRALAPGGGDSLFSDGFETGDPFCWSDGTLPGTYGACDSTEATNFLHELGFHLITEEPSGNRTFSYPNWLGTPLTRLGEAGNVVGLYPAFPYGERLDQTFNLEPSPFFFTGHERDLNQTGQNADADDVDYMHMRSYWPLYQRFLSPDPVSGAVGSSQSWNRNAYVMGNPLNLVDRYGLLSGSITVVAPFLPFSKSALGFGLSTGLLGVAGDDVPTNTPGNNFDSVWRSFLLSQLHEMPDVRKMLACVQQNGAFREVSASLIVNSDGSLSVLGRQGEAEHAPLSYRTGSTLAMAHSHPIGGPRGVANRADRDAAALPAGINGTFVPQYIVHPSGVYQFLRGAMSEPGVRIFSPRFSKGLDNVCAGITFR